MASRDHNATTLCAAALAATSLVVYRIASTRGNTSNISAEASVATARAAEALETVAAETKAEIKAEAAAEAAAEAEVEAEVEEEAEDDAEGARLTGDPLRTVLIDEQLPCEVRHGALDWILTQKSNQMHQNSTPNRPEPSISGRLPVRADLLRRFIMAQAFQGGRGGQRVPSGAMGNAGAASGQS